MKRVVLGICLLTALAVGIFLVSHRPGAQASPDVTISVNSTADTNSRDSVLTLREAMLLATGELSVGNLHEGECHQVSTAAWVGWPLYDCIPLGPPPGVISPDTIVFDTTVFPPGSPGTIALGSFLPNLSTGSDTVDGSSAGVMVDCQSNQGFYISSDNNTIKGLQIYGGESGLWIAQGADNNTIGGSTAAERNVISGHWLDGVVIEGNGNIVKGNYIGTDAAGTGARQNNVGVRIGSGAQNNTIGGTTAGERNVISGNDNTGVLIQSSDGNTVKGNYIGTNASGTAALPNEIGVSIEEGAHNNTIGGTSAGERNVISGNSYVGLQIYEAATSGNVVKGNYIGTSPAGTAAVPNNVGVRIGGGAQNNTIGGSTAVERNVMSGNTTYGVMITGSTTDGNTVKGNYIGTNASGTGALPNVQAGVVIEEGAHNNTIGGTTAGERNVISGNVSQGVLITGSGANGNTVKGNYIGTNAAGTAALRNAGWGVTIAGGAQNNTIGGSTAAERNVISGNLYDGVGIAGDGTNGNTVKGNYIGTDPAGSAALGNASCGVAIWNRAQHNTIGGTAAGEGNIIAYNTEDGVRVWATGNTVRGNSIHSNGGKGIDSDEPTPPTITGFGSVMGTACPSCTIDIYSDDEDEGRVYEGSTTANRYGNWSFAGSPEGPNVTATATDSGGNTSEFSAPVLVPEPLDSDSDGFTDAVEAYLGTDPLDACPDGPGDDAWPPDVNGGTGCGSHNGQVNILDVLCYKPKLPPNPYDHRYDLNADGSVNILDVLLYKPFLNTSCTNP